MESNTHSGKKRTGWTEYEYPDRDDRGHIDDGLLIEGIYAYPDVDIRPRGCLGWTGDQDQDEYPCVELKLSTADLRLNISMTPGEVQGLIDQLQTAIVEAETEIEDAD